MTKITPTIDQVAYMAEHACYYVTPEGQWLKVEYADREAGYFIGLDECMGQDYNIEMSEVTLEGKEAFHELVLMNVANLIDGS